MAAHVEQLIKAGISAQDIAVIAPYNLQVHSIMFVTINREPSLAAYYHCCWLVCLKSQQHASATQGRIKLLTTVGSEGMNYKC